MRISGSRAAAIAASVLKKVHRRVPGARAEALAHFALADRRARVARRRAGTCVATTSPSAASDAAQPPVLGALQHEREHRARGHERTRPARHGLQHREPIRLRRVRALQQVGARTLRERRREMREHAVVQELDVGARELAAEQARARRRSAP